MSQWTRELYWNLGSYAVLSVLALVVLLVLYLFVPSLHQRWLPLKRLRPGKWTGHEVFLAFCIFYGFPDLIIAILLQIGFFTPLIGPMPDVDAPVMERSLYLKRCNLISSPLLLTVILGVQFAVMYARSGSRPHHYGLTWARWPNNLALGLLTFVLATPFIFGVYVLATLVFASQPHPFQVLGQLDLQPWEWAMIAFQATLMAPILEETLLRGILQGWLRRASLIGHVTILFLTIFFAAMNLLKYDKDTDSAVFNDQGIFPVLFASALTTGYAYTMYWLVKRYALPELAIMRWLPTRSVLTTDAAGPSLPVSKGDLQPQLREQDDARLRHWIHMNSLLAIYGSAMLFAATHPSWPAPLALFPMGLVLGWLRHRTQSLVGPMIYHALFNFASCIALYGTSPAVPPTDLPPDGKEQTTAVRPSVVGSMTSSVPGSQ